MRLNKISLFLLSMVLCGQSLIPEKLTVDQIMQGPALYGYTPRNIRWSPDGQQLIFAWKQAAESIDEPESTYSINRDGTKLRKLAKAEIKNLPPANAMLHPSKNFLIYGEGGDIYEYNIRSKKIASLVSTNDAETSVAYSHNGDSVLFVRNNNLYSLSRNSGELNQFTDVRIGGSDTGPNALLRGSRGSSMETDKGTESQEWLKKEQIVLIDFLKRQAETKKINELEQSTFSRKPFMLPPGSTVAQMQLTPDKRHVLINVLSSSSKTINTIVPSYVTEKGYVESIPSRNKVGDTQTTSQWWSLDVKTGEAKAFQLMLDKDSKRPFRLSSIQWNDEGTRAIAQARALDNKDAWIVSLHVDNAELRILYNEHNDAWVGGPTNDFGWINNEDLYFTSEESGWSHVYRMSFRGEKAIPLTSGSWEVQSVSLFPNRQDFLLVTNENDHAQKHIYRMSIRGGPRTRLTNKQGFHSPTLSPDGQKIADLYSAVAEPPEIYLQSADSNISPARVTQSPALAFQNYPWVRSPLSHFIARDGAKVPVRVYKPRAWKDNGPVVLFIHGAGYLQNAHLGWSSYAREFMFHHLLMEKGFLVIDLDYRGSAGYGRDWRTAIAGFMGGKDLDDAVDAAAWATKEFNASPKRIGLYGGSYGGFITLMGLFTQSQVFASGAALRPVTDWAHYNHGYTSNILGLPQKDSAAYRKSSPIYLAEGLTGTLLICHGMIDTNVHFQDTVRLTQRLIELGKENWELAVYPIEDHGFQQSASWADEYKRILKLFQSTLQTDK